MQQVALGGMIFTIPYADLLPPLSDQEYAQLKADIAERGIIVPVIVGRNNRIIDGQHRIRIAAELGLPLGDVPREMQILDSEDDERRLCDDLNTHRRQLTAERRQAWAVQLRERGQSIRQISETTGASVGTIHADLQRAGVQNRTPAEMSMDVMTGKKLPVL